LYAHLGVNRRTRGRGTAHDGCDAGACYSRGALIESARRLEVEADRSSARSVAAGRHRPSPRTGFLSEKRAGHRIAWWRSLGRGERSPRGAESRFATRTRSRDVASDGARGRDAGPTASAGRLRVSVAAVSTAGAVVAPNRQHLDALATEASRPINRSAAGGETDGQAGGGRQ
jgi:hypothetical protein